MTIATRLLASTPMARLWVTTTTATVMTMTLVSPSGMRRSVAGAMECQSNVLKDTSTITATSAAIGIWDTHGPKTMQRIMRKTPAAKVETRVRAPFRTLIMVWPIIAQQTNQPKKPVNMLAMPWPIDSRVLPEGVSVMSSTSLAVISDSISPTSASASAYGAISVSVSTVNGTSGRPGTGRKDGSTPRSPTVGTASPAPSVIAVSTAMDTSGAGTTRVIRGKNTISAS